METFEKWIMWLSVLILLIVFIIIILNIFFVYIPVDIVRKEVESNSGNFNKLETEISNATEATISTESKIDDIISDVEKIINVDLPSIKSDTTEIGNVTNSITSLICNCSTGAVCCTNGKFNATTVKNPGCAGLAIAACFLSF